MSVQHGRYISKADGPMRGRWSDQAKNLLKMKLEFEIHTSPESFEAEDGIINALNDDGLRSDVETVLALELQQIMWWKDIQVITRLTEWK
jgi:hypothetical protein